MKGLVAAQPAALYIHFHSKDMHGEQVTPVVNITYATGLGSTVALPWSLYVIKAKHEVNLISIFNITRLKNR